MLCYDRLFQRKRTVEGDGALPCEAYHRKTVRTIGGYFKIYDRVVEQEDIPYICPDELPGFVYDVVQYEDTVLENTGKFVSGKVKLPY